MTRGTGGELIARMLAAEGVRVVFGIVDGTYFGLYASLPAHSIRLVSPRHEATAVHMAGAYARTTGELGVCLASNGPGLANALAGIAVENGEGNRVLVISSWRRAAIVGPDRGGTYQYFDQVGATKPITKWSGAARTAERIQETLQRAFRISFRGRPGVVHVTVPEDVLNSPSGEPPALLAPHRYRRTEPLEPAPGEVSRCLALIEQAERPLIQAGSGVVHANAGALVIRLAETIGAPITTSWGGRSAIDERAAVSVPLNPALMDPPRREADLVLALGARFGETDWWGKPPYWGTPDSQRVIQVDLDPDSLGLNRPVDVAVLADAGAFTARLLEEASERPPSPHLPARLAALERLAETKRQLRAALVAGVPAESSGALHSGQVPLVCRELMDDDAVLVIDGGNTAVWANLLHENRTPGSLLGTFKLGMLGAGVGQALGAKVAVGDRQVVCILGDGAMGFHAMEIETAVRCGLSVIFVVVCDGQWGMVKLSQGMALDPETMATERRLPAEQTINTDFSATRWDQLARSMGARGEHASSTSALRAALERALADEGCTVIHAAVDPVAHLWAPGLDVFKAMHLEPGEPAAAVAQRRK